MKVIASKPDFNPIHISSRHDLFLTDIKVHNVDFCVEHFIEKELSKEKAY
jgi:hypothetical protein